MRQSTASKAIIALFFAAEVINCANAAEQSNRIKDLESQRDIYASRVVNWQNRAMQDEEIIDRLQSKTEMLPDDLTMEYAGEFMCTAYCTEQREHICGSGDGITASGAPVTAGLTVAADESVPFGTVLYIEGVGIRVVQDRGAAIQGDKLDVAVSESHDDALNWDGYGKHRVWIMKESEK